MAFFGEYEVSLTEGGRIVLPKKIRENLKGDKFVLTKGFDVCLAGYDKDDWDVRSKDLLSMSLLDKENIDRRRFMFSGANYIGVDEQGRFVIPRSLMSFMGLKQGGVKIVGVGDHFEIWESGSWSKYLKKISV